jgi:hypothetical protein
MPKETERIEPTFDSGLLLPPRQAAAESSTLEINRYKPTTVPLEVADQKVRTGRPGRLAPYEKAGRVIRLMGWLSILAWVGIFAAVLVPVYATGRAMPREFAAMGVVAGLISTAIFMIARAVFQRKTWGRVAGVVYAVFNLPVFPIGTVVGIYLLWILPFKWHDEA